jgi:uncharacterized delta-60 repeat protein
VTYAGWNLDDIQIKGFQSPLFYSLDGTALRKQTSYSSGGSTWTTLVPRGGLGGDDTSRTFALLANGQISEFSPTSQTVIRTFAAPGGQPEGLAFDGYALYVSNAAGELYTLHPDTGAVLNRVLLPEGALFGLGALAAGRIADPSPGIALVGGQLYVTAGGAIGQPRLYRWDGQSLQEAVDVRPGPLGAAPQQLTTLGAELLFSADDGRHGRELWAVGQTVRATYRVDAQAGAVVRGLDFGALDVVVSPPKATVAEGTYRDFTATLSAPGDANQARYRFELLRKDSVDGWQMVDAGPWTPLVRPDGSGIHDLVVTHEFLLPDDGEYQARTQVESIVAGNGSVTIDLGQNETAVASIEDAQGRTITAVYREVIGGATGTSAGYLVAHLPNGSVDTTFGNNGIVHISSHVPSDLGVDSLNRLVVAARVGTSLSLWRFLPDGHPDTSFGANGSRLVSPGGQVGVARMIVSPAGTVRTLFSTSGTQSSYYVFALDSSGSPLAGFGTDGLAPIPLADFYATDLAVASDESLRIAGFRNYPADTTAVILKLQSNGSVDASFGVSGVASLDSTAGNARDDRPVAIQIQSDERILLSYTSQAGSNSKSYVARLLADGSVDATFAGSGERELQLPNGSFRPGTLYGGQLGKISVVGASFDGETWQPVIARLNDAGDLDSTFGANGLLYLGTPKSNGPGRSFMSADGTLFLPVSDQIIKRSGVNLDAVVYRVLSSGVPDYAFGGSLDPLTYFDTQSVVVGPTEPRFLLTGLPMIVEQVDWTHAVSFSDAGEDRWIATIDYGDGTVVHLDATELADRQFVLSHRYRDDRPPTGDAEFEITVTIQDLDDGFSTTESIRVLVQPAQPVVQSLTAEPADEATEWTASGLIRDGADTLRVGVDYGDGSPPVIVPVYAVDPSQGLVGFDLTHVYDNDVAGGYTVTVRVYDEDDQLESDPFTITAAIGNVPPVLAGAIQFPATPEEGRLATFLADFADQGADVLTILWDFDYDGQAFDVQATGPQVEYAFPDNKPPGESYQVAVQAFDGSGWSEVAVVNVQPENANPVIGSFPDTAASLEGQTVTFAGSVIASDVPSDTLSFEWIVKDASQTVVASSTNPDFDFTPDNDGIYTLELLVFDDEPDGRFDEDEENDSGQRRGEAFQTLTLTVANVAPTFRIDGPSTAVEGAPLVFRAEDVVEAGPLDATQLTYAWTVTSVGGDPLVTGSTGELAFTPLQDGDYWIRLTVADDDQQVTRQLPLTVGNAAPLLAGLQVYDGLPANVPVRFQGSFSDSGLLDVHTGTVSVNPTMPIELNGEDFEFEYLFPGPGTYQVQFQVRDLDGGVTTQVETVVVGPADHVPPAVTVHLLATDNPAPALTGTIDDPLATIEITVADRILMAQNLGDGTWLLPGEYFSEPLGSGRYDIRVLAGDQAGNVGRDNTLGELNIVLYPPTGVLLAQEPVEEDTSTAADLLFGTLSAEDADVSDVHDYELVAGEGDTDNNRFVVADDRIYLKQGQVLDYETQPSYSVRVRVTDAVGNTFDQTLTLTVQDAAPRVTAFSVSDTLISDADTGPGKTFTFAVDFSEVMNTAILPVLTIVPSHQATLGNPAAAWIDSDTFAVTYEVSDQNVDLRGLGITLSGARDMRDFAQQDYALLEVFDIDTRSPAWTSLSPDDNSVGMPRDTDLTITFGEPVQKGAGTIVIRRAADSSVVESIDVSSSAVTVDGSTATIALASPLAGSTDMIVEVAAGAFQDLAGNEFAGIAGPTDWNFDTNLIVTGLTPLSTGFRIRFSQNLAAEFLNLYDQGGVLGPADLTLIGAATGPVRGSLVIGPDPREATFIKTAGLLSPDQYTVNLISAAAAFRDLDGALLDGERDGTPGGHYASSFTVAPAEPHAVTVSLPNFARGYGQPVNLPANVLTAGLPLRISNAGGVTRVELAVQYDPALLSISAFTLDAGVASRATSTVDTSTPGRIVLTITAATGLADVAGPLTLGSFTAQVPDDAPYGGKHMLDITDLRVFDNSPTPIELPAIGDDAIHVAAFFGDANGDGTYNSPDATLVRRIIGQANTGLAAYQLADPELIADISLNGFIQSNDTTNIRRVIGQMAVPNIPLLPEGLVRPAPSGADPLVYIPRDLAGTPGGTVTVPVRLQVTERAGITLSGFEVVIEYDPSYLTVTGSQLGTLLSGTDVSGSLTSPAPGRLVYTASAFRGSGLLPWGTAGDLFTVTFAIAEHAPAGASVLNLRSGLGPTSTALFDAQLNNLVLVPAPTDSPTDRVDGLLAIRGRRPSRPAWPIQDRREVRGTIEALASPPSSFVLRSSSLVRPSFFVPVPAPSAVDQIADELARLRVRSGAVEQQDVLDAVFGRWGQGNEGL